MREVLAHIEAGALLPPLVVLQTLAKNPQLKLSVVKDYAARMLSAEGAMVEEDRKAIARFEEETASMRAEVTELKTKACRRIPSQSRSALELEELRRLMRRLLQVQMLDGFGDRSSSEDTAPGNGTAIWLWREGCLWQEMCSNLKYPAAAGISCGATPPMCAA